ncbi:hypothetical protein SVAN01_08156 [Stagonosporopsis vannaccii]|nr:hypothetical protein SVAN01_08156 [Stagonosporopsis vannaccii]
MSLKPLTLISATPSAFARMNRIALTLKGIPYNVENEIPWESTTNTPKYNPLEQLPILLFPDERPPIYNSAHIQNYIVEKYASEGPSLLPGDLDSNLLAKQIAVLSSACMDALVIYGWEVRRKKEQQNQKWMDRQLRKLDGSMRAFSEYVEAAKGRPYVLGTEITIADIGIMCAVDGIEFTGARPEWKAQHPALAEYVARLGQLKVFQDTKPVMFDMTEEVV